MLIINHKKDFADMFDYPVISIFDTFQVAEILDILRIAEHKSYILDSNYYSKPFVK